MRAISHRHTRLSGSGTRRHAVGLGLAGFAALCLSAAALPLDASAYTVYVANKASNSITPIDTATDIAASPITVGNEPWGVAITPNGKTVYVANSGANTVTPINTATNTAGTAINVGSKPTEVAVTPNGKTVYVDNFSSNSVTPINTATNTAGTAIAVGKGPDNLAITPDGKTVYVVNSSSNSVTPIDTATNTAGTAIAVGKGPTSIAVTPDGKTAYVSCNGAGTVTPIDVATNTTGSAINAGGKPENLAITPDGTTVLVAIGASDKVVPIDTATNTKGESITVGNEPVTVAVTPDGATAYVSNRKGGSVSPITLATSTAGAPITVGSTPLQLAISPDQAPVASFTITPGIAGTESSFDASASSVAFGSIANYHWSFGDGESADTATPTTEHTYAVAGEYTVTLTETDSTGTSTSTVFTGQTVSRNGGPGAQKSHALTIVPPAPVNTAVPTITGTAQQGQKLTAHNGSWTNAPTGYTYQWLQCDAFGGSCLPIAGATGQTYTPVAADVGHTLAVQETASNAGGPGSPATSVVTAVVVPPPPVNTAAPTITGLAQQGQTLTEHNGSWTNSPSEYAYQWLRCDSKGEGCVAIPGATESTYLAVAEDLGHTIRVQETAGNAGGSGSPATSAASAAIVPPGAPVNTTAPTITGTATQGQELVEHNGSWTNSPTGYTYQWLRCNGKGEGCVEIPGATGQTYVAVEADAGHTLAAQETASNGVGEGSPAQSPASEVILPLAPVNSAAPTISGTVQQGQTLSEQNGSWTHHPTAYAYQWLRCDAKGEGCVEIAGAAEPNYVPVAEDVGQTLKVQETASNAGGSGSPATSTATAVVLVAAPETTSAPTVTGTAQQGQELVEHNGSWTNSPTEYAYQWLRCDSKGEGCVAIPGATESTYLAVAEDVGHTIAVQEIASNAGGSSGPTQSLATAVVLVAAPESTSAPTISGTVQEGQLLSEQNGSWTHNPTAFAYQWLRCDSKGKSCSAIGGATESAYVPVAEDVGQTLKVQETASNAGGSGSPATSTATAVVLVAAPETTSAPTVTGTAQQGQELVEHNGSWTNSPTEYAYQWLRCDSKGEGCVAIPGATESTYLAVAEDVGHTIAVQEIASNAGGSSGPAQSLPTAVVVPPVPANTAAPSITGAAEQGQTLKEHNGSWTNTPTAYAYQWLRCDEHGEACTAIPGATSQSYNPVAEDVGRTIRVQETASNAGGAGGAAQAAPTAVIAAAPATPGEPSASGEPIRAPSPESQQPSGDPLGDTAALRGIRVVISARSVRLAPNGDVVITVVCPSTAVGGCKGTLTLRAAPSHKHSKRAVASKCARGCRSLGSGTYEARAGTKVKVRAHVASFERKVIAKRKSVRVTLTATNVVGGHTATTVLAVTLKSHSANRKGATRHA